MHPDIKIWLKDIEISIKEIHEFLPPDGSFDNFRNDLKARKAIERNVEIIGEAMKRLLDSKPEIKISGSRKIVDTRNRIIHGYNNISADVIWLIITRDLPVLEKEVEYLLKEGNI